MTKNKMVNCYSPDVRARAVCMVFEHQGSYESICRFLPVAPSTYYDRLACETDPSKASARHRRDMDLRPVAKGLALLAQFGCDAALLDINPGRETSEPIARELIKIGSRPLFWHTLPTFDGPSCRPR